MDQIHQNTHTHPILLEEPEVDYLHIKQSSIT